MSLVYDNNKTYSHNKKSSELYIFDIEVTNDTKNILRKIRNSKEGNIINTDDNINNNITKIKLSIFDFNNPEISIVLRKKFSSDIVEYNILTKDNIIITLSSIQNCIVCNYSII